MSEAPQSNESTTELENLRFEISPDVTFEQRIVGGETCYLVRHGGLDKYFHMGTIEYRVAQLLDGQHSLGEIASQLDVEGIDWNLAEITVLAKHFLTHRIAFPAGQPPSAPVPDHDAAPNLLRGLPKLLSFTVSQRLPLFAFDRIATRICSWVGAAFSGTAIAVWALFVASALAVVSCHQEQLHREILRLFDNQTWWIVLAICAVVKVFHECGHAVAARYHGVRTGKAGIMFFMFAPIAYVDVTDAWKLKNRWQRIQIALAGIYVELAIASVAAWGWWFWSDTYWGHLAAQTFLIAGPATLLINANPLLRLDGYYVLSDLVDIPNLRMHGRRQLGGLLNRWLVRIEPEGSLLSGWRRHFATAHAFCSVLFQLVWMTGLVIGVSWWAKGLGIAIAVAASILWGVLPLGVWAYRVWQHSPGEPWARNIHRRRLVTIGSVVIAGAVYLVTAPSPLVRRVPVVVRFHDAQIVRAAADSFVDKINVSRGERVLEGQLLVQLSNPELVLQRDIKADELDATRLRIIQHRRNREEGVVASEIEKLKSLQRQLAELDARIDKLTVYSHRDGVVVCGAIESYQGKFIDEGTELLQVCDPQRKELVIAVSPSDVEAFERASLGGEPLTVRLRGGQTFKTKATPLRPRAAFTLPHPAMGANHGGPIPVEPVPATDEQSSESVRPIDAQMESVTQLDPVTSTELRAGQLGMLSLADTRSLITRWIESFRQR